MSINLLSSYQYFSVAHPLEEANTFYVRRMRKLIKCLPLHEFILLFTEYLQIPCQCCRIAAHIYNPLRLHLNHGIKYTLFESFSWRIDYDHICVRMFSRMIFGIIRIESRQHFFSTQLFHGGLTTITSGRSISVCLVDAVSSVIFSFFFAFS